MAGALQTGSRLLGRQANPSCAAPFKGTPASTWTFQTTQRRCQAMPAALHTSEMAFGPPLKRFGSRRYAVMCAARATQSGGGGTTTGSSGGGRTMGGKKKVKKLVDINGDVTKDMGNGMFTVKLENGVSVMAHLSGKIRQNRIKIVMGDKVTVELSPYDLTRGRITYRFKPGELEAAANQASASQG